MKLDMRYGVSREKEVVAYLKAHKGAMDMTWLLANRMRSPALARLISDGRVQPLKTDDRALLKYRVREEKKPSLVERVLQWCRGVLA